MYEWSDKLVISIVLRDSRGLSTVMLIFCSSWYESKYFIRRFVVATAVARTLK